MGARTPPDLNLQQLRVFLVLGEELHFGRTAERLLLTQPHVSRTLAALERRVGGRLLDRTSRSVRLTRLGEQFHAELTLAYGTLVRAFERAHDAAGGFSGTLVVGCTTTSAGPALTRLVTTFERRHPEYQVRLRELPLNHPYAALRNGAVDVLVFWLPDAAGELTLGSVIEEQPMVLGMRSGHPLSGQDAVSLESMAEYGVPDMAGVDGPRSIEHALWPSTTPSGRPVPRVGPPCRTMGEIVDTLTRTDATKPTVLSFARATSHRGDLVFRTLIDASPLRLGPSWLGRTDRSIETFAAVAKELSERRALGAEPPR